MTTTPLLAICLLSLAAVCTAGDATTPEVLIDLAPGTAAWAPPTSGERVTGSVPAGWHDDTGWAKTWVDYQQRSDDGRPFWRVEVTKRETGRAQLFHPVPDLASEGVYRLTATIRATGLSGFEYGLRQRGSPWEWVRNQQPAVTGTWQEVSWTFRQAPRPEPMGFYVGLDGIGTFDIARLRLERWSLAGYLELTRAAPAAGPKNLLRVTRAPADLPPGWSLDRDDSDDEVAVDSDLGVTGPGGGPALRLRSAKPRSNLWCGALAVPAGATHVASLWVRGTGSGALQVVADGQQVAEARFTIGEAQGWQRVQTPFEPVVLAEAHALRLAFTGRIWIDALQVERGPAATAYESPFPCEIGLHHESPALVQFSPEVEVGYAILGAIEGATVAVEAVDVYGRRAALPPQPAVRRGAVRCAALADRPFGALRLEATVVGADGRPLSAPAEIVVHRLPEPRHWGQDAPESFFGVHTNSTRRHNLMAKAIGANWVRGHDAGQYTTWFQLEPERGRWMWRDAEINRYRDQHLMMLGMLSTAPRWASTVGDDHEGYFDQYYQPRDLADWQAYVRTVTTRYRGVIGAWEVWNEPWGGAFWHVGKDHQRKIWLPGPAPAADYARLMASAYAAAKAVDPALTILGFNTCDGRSDWTEGVRDAAGLAACDVVSYHQYSTTAATADDKVATGYREAVGPLLGADGRPPKPVWLSEGSPLVACDGPGLYRLTMPGAQPEDASVAGDRCARWLVSLRARGVRKAFLYSMHCHGYFTAPAQFRSVVGRDGYLHPVADAYAACAWRIDDTEPAGISAPVAGVTAFAFQGRGRAVVALAPQAGHADLRIPAGVDAADLFGNPLPAGTPLGSTMAYLSADGQAAALLARLR